MLDPRIYRSGLVAVALAVIVVAFSLYNQQGSLGTTLAPDAFNGQSAYATMTSLATGYPDRRPGSAGDDALAGYAASQFRRDGFAVSTSSFPGRTVDGPRTLETVTAVRTGLSSGSIVVVSHRDALGAPATADLSGTATLLELARVLSGETLQRTVVLASTTGSAGAVGATQLAGSLSGSVDAVIVLGDLAGTGVHSPVLVPWSNGLQVAPPMLRNTLATSLGAQAQLAPGAIGLAGQFVHLAFPLTVSEQGPFGARGAPAVLLSVSGEREPSPREATNPTRITALGRTVLQTISALDSGPSIPAPSAYLLYHGKVVPAWAIRLLVLALILPVLGATIDGVARARRRGHSVSRWVVWVLASAVPFLLALLFVLGARTTGLLADAPPGPLGAGAVPLHATGIVLLGGMVCVVGLSFIVLRPLVLRAVGGVASRRSGESLRPGASAAVLLVLCAVSLAIWVRNPFAAALVVPALHSWIWVVAPDFRLNAAAKLALLVAGLAAPVLVAVYYALALGLGPMGVAWNGLLLLAGGQVGMVAAIEWSVLLGCVASVAVIALRGARQDRAQEAPVTVRGPITYAGPGSLGGTESALRR